MFGRWSVTAPPNESQCKDLVLSRREALGVSSEGHISVFLRVCVYEGEGKGT